MGEVKVTAISPSCDLGEGPHWIERNQTLLFVDLSKGILHRYFNDSKRIQTLHIEDVGTGHCVSFVVPVEGTEDQFVIGVGKSLATVTWPTSEPDDQVKRPTPFVSVDDHVENTRFNDAKCDPAGRLWAGTMDNAVGLDLLLNKGSLYRFDSKLIFSKLVEKVSISNGLAWSHDKKTLYYIDSMEYRVDAYNYDHTTGEISNRKTVLDFKEPPGFEGVPDGMSIDVEGNLWVACFGSGQVLCLDPRVGKVTRTIKIPSKQTTSTCWGGPDYSTLFVTSANLKLTEEDLKSHPQAGKLFAVTGLGTKGLPGYEFKLEPKF